MHGRLLLSTYVSRPKLRTDNDRMAQVPDPADARDGLRHMQTRIRIAYAMIAVTYIATISSILLGCQPMRKNWQISPDPGSTLLPIVCGSC